MVYTPKTWQDKPSHATPVTATDLNHIEQGIAAAARAWQPGEVLTAGEVRVAPDGHVITRNANGTARGSYDATEQALWTVVGGGSGAGALLAANNLSDVASAATARTNLGLGTAATQSTSAFDTAGAAALRAPLLTPTATKTATYTAAVGDLAMMNVAGGATALTLPTAPADKAQVGYRAIGATSTVPLTISRGGSTDTIGTAGATSATIALADEVVVLQYDAPNTRWLAVANVKTQASLDKVYMRPPVNNLGGMWVGAYGGSPNNFNVLGGSFTSASTLVQNHQIAIDCTDLRVVLPFGWQELSGGTAADGLLANSTATKVAIQVGSTFYPVTFRGARSVTCDPGGRLISDPIGGFWAKGTQIKLRILNGSTNGAQYINGQPATGPGISPSFTGNAFTIASDTVDATSTPGNTNPNDNLWGGLLLGRPLAAVPFIFGCVGDSIADGTGDSGIGFSWFTRATNAAVPAFRNTRAGATAQAIAGMNYYSMPMLGGCTHVAVLLGTNDLLNARTFAQITADLTKIYQGIAGTGAKVIGVTIPPHTTSTDSWATTANQTISGADYSPAGSTSIRSQVNTWIRAGGAGLLVGFIELADVVESARDSGIWKAAYTADGTHPTVTGHTAIAAAVNLTTIAAL